jgi:tetratricopeptide (TPR) repeat protein
MYLVLYSARSGWWKIADFGLTATGTSQHLRSTTGRRGRACYRAPELIRDTGSGYNKKVDIWSLGCILFELCVRKKAFKDDFDTFQFAASKKVFVTEFPSWFEQSAKERYGSLIQQMLNPDHEKRPSIEALCESHSGFISLISGRSGDEIRAKLKEDLLLRGKYLLGTDVPSEESLRSVRWDKGLPGGTLETGVQQVERWERLIEAREMILGPEHPNTIWGMISLAWTYIFTGDSHRATANFQEALDITLKVKGAGHMHSLFSQYGLAWAYMAAGKLGPSAKLFEEILDTQYRYPEPTAPRDMLVTRAGLARNHLLWRPHELTIPMLESLIDEQKTAAGNDHPETLESISLLASAYLLQRDSTASLRAAELFGEVFSAETRLFGIEHPALLTLCGLSWTCARLGQIREATRIFGEIESAQKRLLGGEYPMTTSSLESLGIWLNRGQILWGSQPGTGPVGPKANNPYGARGGIKCEACRMRRIKVHNRCLNMLTPVRIQHK